MIFWNDDENFGEPILDPYAINTSGCGNPWFSEIHGWLKFCSVWVLRSIDGNEKETATNLLLRDKLTVPILAAGWHILQLPFWYETPPDCGWWFMLVCARIEPLQFLGSTDICVVSCGHTRWGNDNHNIEMPISNPTIILNAEEGIGDCVADLAEETGGIVCLRC